jgi:hypothetical protein
VTRVLIKKEKDDPIALRASVGGNEKDGYYLVYRGNLQLVKKMIKRVQEAIDIYEK